VNNNSVQTLNFNSIKVKIFDHFVVALIDSGSGLSVISERLVRKLRLKIENLDRGQNSILIAANGSPINVKGKVSICIKLGGLSVPFDCLVVENLSQNLILGVDFLESTKALINWEERTVTFMTLW